MSLFKRHFDGGSRPVKVYFQSGVDAQFVADLQRMVTVSRGRSASQILIEGADCLSSRPEEETVSVVLLPTF